MAKTEHDAPGFNALHFAAERAEQLFPLASVEQVALPSALQTVRPVVEQDVPGAELALQLVFGLVAEQVEVPVPVEHASDPGVAEQAPLLALMITPACGTTVVATVKALLSATVSKNTVPLAARVPASKTGASPVAGEASICCCVIATIEKASAKKAIHSLDIETLLVVVAGN